MRPKSNRFRTVQYEIADGFMPRSQPALILDEQPKRLALGRPRHRLPDNPLDPLTAYRFPHRTHNSHDASDSPCSLLRTAGQRAPCGVNGIPTFKGHRRIHAIQSEVDPGL